MYDLSKVDLGKDDAERDENLVEYFLETAHYRDAHDGKKTLVIGGKGSGKSAIFRLLQSALAEDGGLVVPMTLDQHAWAAVRECRETGAPLQHSQAIAWRLALLSAAVCRLGDAQQIPPGSALEKLYKRLKKRAPAGLLSTAVDWVKRVVQNTETQWVRVNWKGVHVPGDTPVELAQKLTAELETSWPRTCKNVRILLDRLDECWDGSEDAEAVLVGLLKAASHVNHSTNGSVLVTVFMRDDIYDNLLFDDRDKGRQYEDRLKWRRDDLKKIVEKRVRFSLALLPDAKGIWEGLFSAQAYRGRTTAETYIIERTFMRPRDVISFVRSSIEQAIASGHASVEPGDTRLAEETTYSRGKYQDLVIEHKKQFPEFQELLDTFSGSFHKLTKPELLNVLRRFVESKNLSRTPEKLVSDLFAWGVIGVRKYVPADVGRPGRERFVFYYDDPQVKVLECGEYYVHPSLRAHLGIAEKREKKLRSA